MSSQRSDGAPDSAAASATSHLLPPSLLVASSLLNEGGSGLPFASTAPMAPAMLAWALAYPAACIGLAVAAFRRRDL